VCDFHEGCFAFGGFLHELGECCECLFHALCSFAGSVVDIFPTHELYQKLTYMSNGVRV
jgi:hypothetical protein